MIDDALYSTKLLKEKGQVTFYVAIKKIIKAIMWSKVI